jgi:hypothetical protein
MEKRLGNNALDFYFGDSRFEFQPGNGTSRLSVSVVASVRDKCWGSVSVRLRTLTSESFEIRLFPIFLPLEATVRSDTTSTIQLAIK